MWDTFSGCLSHSRTQFACSLKDRINHTQERSLVPTVWIRSFTTWIILPPNSEETIGEPPALKSLVTPNAIGGAGGLLVQIFGYNRATAWLTLTRKRLHIFPWPFSERFPSMFSATYNVFRTFQKCFETFQTISRKLERFKTFQTVSERFWTLIFSSSRCTTRNCETHFLGVFPIVAHNLRVV